MKVMCELCGEKHLEIRKKNIVTEFKNERIEYESEFGYCPELDEEILVEGMLDRNLNRMRNAYRISANLLTSEEIIR